MEENPLHTAIAAIESKLESVTVEVEELDDEIDALMRQVKEYVKLRDEKIEQLAKFSHAVSTLHDLINRCFV